MANQSFYTAKNKYQNCNESGHGHRKGRDPAAGAVKLHLNEQPNNSNK